MTIQDDLQEIEAFCDILGLREEPLGLFYTPVAPREAISPQAAVLPSAELERAGELDWEATFANFSCVIGVLWRARPPAEDQPRPQTAQGSVERGERLMQPPFGKPPPAARAFPPPDRQ